MSDRWTDPEADPRTYGNPVGEKATLQEYLTNYRLTIELKCEGLDSEQLARRAVPPSTMSLLGLVRHLAEVEGLWFRRTLQGRTDQPWLYRRDDDHDACFTDVVADPALMTAAFADWKAEMAAAGEWFDGLDEADLGRTVPVRGDEVSIRDILVHMVEEYARHAGHADLLRECIDGRTGE